MYKYIQYTVSDIISLIFSKFKYRLLFILIGEFFSYAIFAFILKAFGELLNIFATNSYTEFSFFLKLLIILHLTNIALSGISKLLCSYITPQIVHVIQTTLFNHILKNNTEYFQQNSPTKIMHSIHALRSCIYQILEFYLQITYCGMGQIINVYMSFQIHKYFGFLTLAYLSCICIKFMIFAYYSRNMYQDYVKRVIYLNDDASDTLRNMNNAVNLCGTKSLESERFTTNSDFAAKKSIYIERIVSITAIIGNCIFVIVDYITYLIGWELHSHHIIHVGQLAQYTSILIEIMVTSRSLMQSIPYYFGSVQNIRVQIQILGAPVKEYNDQKQIDNIQEIQINSTFGHPRNPTLFQNLELNFTKGYTYGLVGESGSGKSTLAAMLLGILPEYKGNFTIINKDQQKFELNEICLTSLQKRITIMSQSNELFMQRTILENIQYGLHGISSEEAIQAGQKAHAHNFIACLDEQYNTIPAKSALKLSGGQIQRILIARLFAQKDIDFIIFDEGTSALDNYTEYLIKHELKKHKNTLNNPAIIIIAHRLTTLKDVDMIYVFSNGKIAESGNHQTLMKQGNSIYKSLYDRGFAD